MACLLQLSADKTFSLPPCDAARENSIVLTRMSAPASHINPEFDTRTSPRHARTCSNQTHQQAPARSGRGFCREAWMQRAESMETLIHEETGKYLSASSTSRSWQKGLDGVSGWKRESNMLPDYVHSTCSRVYVPAVACRVRSN